MKKRVHAIGVAIVISLLLPGVAALDAQRRSGDEEGISERSVRGHLEFLAGDALNGRGSGTRDEWIAAAYVAGQLRRWGLEPLGDNGGFIQQVDLEQSAASGPPVLSYGEVRLTHGKEMVVQALGQGAASGPLQKLREGTPAQRGAVILLPDPVPAGFGAASGAAVVLMADSPRMRALWASAGTRLPSLPPRPKGTPPAARPPVIVLAKAAYDALSLVAEGTAITFGAELGPATVTHTWNAIGKLAGRDSKRSGEVILLTAHLDHLGSRPGPAGAPPADTIFNGADDDASGSVAVLELAEALATGRRPKRTVIFAWFGSEESGGFGAEHFLDHPPVPLEAIVANLEFEMIGRPDSAVPARTLWLTGYDRTDLGPRLASRGARLVADPHPDQNFFMRSDNIQLARRGVVAQTVSSFGLHQEYHQPSDEVRLVDFTHMTGAIRSMLEPVRWLANSSYKPAWLAGRKP